MHSGKIEPLKQIFAGTWITYHATEDSVTLWCTGVFWGSVDLWITGCIATAVYVQHSRFWCIFVLTHAGAIAVPHNITDAGEILCTASPEVLNNTQYCGHIVFWCAGVLWNTKAVTCWINTNGFDTSTYRASASGLFDTITSSPPAARQTIVQRPLSFPGDLKLAYDTVHYCAELSLLSISRSFAALCPLDIYARWIYIYISWYIYGTCDQFSMPVVLHSSRRERPVERDDGIQRTNPPPRSYHRLDIYLSRLASIERENIVYLKTRRSIATPSSSVLDIWSRLFFYTTSRNAITRTRGSPPRQYFPSPKKTYYNSKRFPSKQHLVAKGSKGDTYEYCIIL